MNKLAVVDVHNEIATFNPLRETRVIDNIKVGQWVRQGDLYIERINKFDQLNETPNRQLAPGETQGSRHTVDESVGVYNYDNAPEFRVSGRIFGPRIKSDTRFTISHPEHAEFSLPAGCYQISYQADWKTQQRVRD